MCLPSFLNVCKWYRLGGLILLIFLVNFMNCRLYFMIATRTWIWSADVLRCKGNQISLHSVGILSISIVLWLNFRYAATQNYSVWLLHHTSYNQLCGTLLWLLNHTSYNQLCGAPLWLLNHTSYNQLCGALLWLINHTSYNQLCGALLWLLYHTSNNQLLGAEFLLITFIPCMLFSSERCLNAT